MQSNTVLALQALGRLPVPYDVFVFANVGDDSENPATIEYIEKYAKPFAKKHGIEFVTVQKKRGGVADTVKEAIMREDTIGIPIPAYYRNAQTGKGQPALRVCTDEFKIRQVDKFAKARAKYAVIGIGISTDEFRRVRTDFLNYQSVINPRLEKSKKLGFFKKVEYPLIDLRIARAQCAEILALAGLPYPPKSSCFFCPYHRDWQTLYDNNPALFDKAVAIENRILEKRQNAGKDPMYLTSAMIPLSEIVNKEQVQLEIWDSCDSGYCHT